MKKSKASIIKIYKTLISLMNIIIEEKESANRKKDYSFYTKFLTEIRADMSKIYLDCDHKQISKTIAEIISVCSSEINKNIKR